MFFFLAEKFFLLKEMIITSKYRWIQSGMDCICGYDWDEDKSSDRRNTSRKREETRRAQARPISRRLSYKHLLRSVYLQYIVG